jgi:uncharacterized protein YjbI with pentapeptide repeats
MATRELMKRYSMGSSDSDVMRLRDRWQASAARARLQAALDAARQGLDVGPCLAGVAGVLEVEGGRDLRGAPLSGCDLAGANLADANLGYAELVGTNLRGVRLCRADLTEANLSGARLDGADMDLCMALFANLEGASLARSRLVRANLMGACLRAANLEGADLRWANLMGASLDGARLEHANLEHARLDSFAPEEQARKANVDARARVNGGSASAIDAAIEQLYRVFASYRQPARSHVSPWAGIKEAEIQKLYSAPLARLAEDDLATYARRALSVWGDASELRHYLPRILDLVARGRRGWLDADLFLSKLEQAGWKSWPEVEKATIERYLHELFLATLAEYPRWPRAGEVVRGVSLAGESLDWYLQTWRDDERPSALHHLADLVLDEQVSLLSNRTVDRSFWHPDALAPVGAFLSAPEHATRLENAFLADPEAPHADTLASAADILRQL